MKKIFFILSVTMFIGGKVLTAANIGVNALDGIAIQNSNQQDQTSEVQKFRKEINERVKENEKAISDFRVKMAKESQEVREKYDKRIDELEQKNKDLKKRMADYNEQEGKSNWQSFKTEFNRDMDELGKALKDLTVRNTKPTNK